jgi:hypothetical protein
MAFGEAVYKRSEWPRTLGLPWRSYGCLQAGYATGFLMGLRWPAAKAALDTPGLDTPATAAAMRVADLSLIPARASTLDLEATRPTLAALARLDRAYAFILNSCPAGRSSRMADARPRSQGPLPTSACTAVCPQLAKADVAVAE